MRTHHLCGLTGEDNMKKPKSVGFDLRSEEEADRLLDIFKSLPTPTSEPTPQELPKKEAKWKHKSIAIKNNGRVNRTKGK